MIGVSHVSDMAALIEPHIPALRRFAWSLTRSGYSADDLVQDCLERAVSRWPSRRLDGDVRAWLFAILNNCFLDDRRRDKRRGRQVALDEMTEPCVDAQQDAGLHYLDVAEAFEQLPDEMRAVILLVGVEDMQYTEAALVLGVPIGTVMSRLSRGRERLRQLISGEPLATGPALRSVK